jgi:hypothetical protein
MLAALLVCVAAAIVSCLRRYPRWRREYDAGLYFVLVGLLSLTGYVVGRCGDVGFFWMRYDLLSLLGACGVVALALAALTNLDPPAPAPSSSAIRARLTGSIVVLLVLWAAFAGVVHGRLWWHYLTNPPEGGKQRVIRELEARGIRYAYADYWYAYAITFLTAERIVVASNSFMRIPSYNTLVDAHRAEAITISREPCAGGEEVIRRVYFCRPPH